MARPRWFSKIFSTRVNIPHVCILAHELKHVARGPVPADPVLAAREEASIDEVVARRLISRGALDDALAWSQEPHEAAELLWVDIPSLPCPSRVAGAG